jgi:hypothetical protein
VRGLGTFRGLGSTIPNLARTRAVYLDKQSGYGLSKIERLRDWAGRLAEPVERGVRQAFAVVDPDVFACRVSARLQASGWKVEHSQQNIRVSFGRFTENVNLLRAIVEMVLARTSFLDATGALTAELGKRFTVDGQLFARFAERFAKYRPAVFDRYFTAYPESSLLAVGWDYWQLAGRDDCGATEIFEQAMGEFESFLAMPAKDWLPAFTGGCCESSITEV